MSLSEEQKARLAEIEHATFHFPLKNDVAWLLALVKELDENCRQTELSWVAARAHALSADERADRAEQQLAAVTAEVKRITDIRYDILRIRAEKAEEQVAVLSDELRKLKGG